MTKKQEEAGFEIIKGNCLEVMDKLYKERGEFVDLIFCDPP
jgi:23S rRNA G2069 N7-methylase RlmK/C1962 C5-methylase RlmI